MTQVLSLKTKIVTPQLAETRDWYRVLLGLVVLEEWEELDDCGCILRLRSTPGKALLEVHLGSEAATYSGMGLHFRVSDIDIFTKHSDERFRFREPIDRPWGSRYLFFNDPNGISVVLFSGTSL
jgi:catechol 2,3-dioxygenase-like lactoylglutathione lyase family enzyme